MKKKGGRKKEKIPEAEASFLHFLHAGNEDDVLWKDWQDAMQEAASPDESVPPEIVAFVGQRTGVAAPKSIRRHLIKIAAAAAILTGVGTCVWYHAGPPAQNGYAVHTIAGRNEYPLTEIQNNSGREERLSLPDQSVVVLQPGAFIRYDRQQFDKSVSKKRDIFLTGSAFFKVAKNPLKPFTVYSGHLSTTALGTEFDILKNGGNTTVKLYHGKVVVRALNSRKGWAKDVYLTQGEMVTLDNPAPRKIRQRAWATTAVPEKKELSKPKKITRQALLPLTCNNMPLGEVLEILEKYYHVTIQCPPGIIKNKYFSGVILRETSPDTILGIICNMQGLQADKTGPGYLIHQ